MVLTFLPLLCITSIVTFVGGFFLGNSESRQEIAYYQNILERNINSPNLSSPQ